MADYVLGDLEPSLQSLLAQADCGGGEVEAVVGCSSQPFCVAATAPTVQADGTRGVVSGDSVAGAIEEDGENTDVQAESSVVRDGDGADRAVISGWKRRPRVGKAPPERALNSSRVTALERTLREFPTRPHGQVIMPEVGVSFDSIGEAYDFYNLYSWERGFGVRYGKSRLNVDRVKCMQEIVCGCSGRPRATNSHSTRCLCTALIRLLRTKDNGWYICEHRDAHTHDLSASFGERAHWPSHRHIDSYTKDLVKQLRENNVNLGKVYSIIGSFFGKMENIPFTKRALKTLCGKISSEQADDDVRKTIEVFSEMGAADPEFTYRMSCETCSTEPAHPGQIVSVVAPVQENIQQFPGRASIGLFLTVKCGWILLQHIFGVRIASMYRNVHVTSLRKVNGSMPYGYRDHSSPGAIASFREKARFFPAQSFLCRFDS